MSNNARRGRYNPFWRRAGIAAIDMALAGGWAARWSHRLGLHGRLRVSKHDVQLPSAVLRTPLVLAFASDFHAGQTTHPDLFAALVDELIARRPDVLLLGGDFVFCKAHYLIQLIRELRRYQAPLGTFAILGNHDLWTNEIQITQDLNAAGVTVLINQNVPLAAPFEGVSICGIDDPWTGNADAARAFSDAMPVRIFLAHSPDVLLLLDNERYDVGFAGHTHGGQIALPNGTPILGAGGPLSRSHSRGRFEIPGNGPLIVSRGVGCSNLPVRINSDSELVICTLWSEP
jgi:predicted MPP superfamily phosphohydrolase